MGPRYLAAFVVLFAASRGHAPLEAQVQRVEIERRTSFADGHAFGTVGPYEKLSGTIHLLVDPADPANERVADLRFAPRNAEGMVEVTTDFLLLKPVDLSRGSGTVLYDVNNRGNTVAMGTFNGAGGNDPSTLADAGNGFLMRRGYSVLWTGWSSDVRPGEGRLTIAVPVATNPDGTPVTGRLLNEIEISVGQLYRVNVLGEDVATNLIQRSYPLVWGNHDGYPPVSLDNHHATLTKRERRSDAGVVIPRSEWAFARWEDGRVIPDPGHIYVEEGLRTGWLYDLVYEATEARIAGLGLVAIRDVISFFKKAQADGVGSPNPLAGAVDHALGYGGSQSARLLNHFLYEGFNADLQGDPVFDALFLHVPGAGKGIFNHRFAQNTRHGSHHEERLYPSEFFPFTSVTQTDPVTGERGSVLDRAREQDVVPKVFYGQTATEYWARAGSLLHTDVEGARDIAPDPSVRIYLYNGVPHNAMTGGFIKNPINRIVSSPLSRALLVALDEWTTEGVEPPPSRYPKIAEGTLMDLEAFREAFPTVPGASVPEDYYQPYRLDLGPRWRSEGVADQVPPLVGPTYRTLVPAVDPDGNELGGIRLPDVAVPLATYTGWNIRDEGWGAEGMLTRWMGSYLPFHRTPEERERAGDPRPSVLERYPTKAEYVRRVTEAARSLQRQRFLLADDADAMIDAAARRDLWGDPRPHP